MGRHKTIDRDEVLNLAERIITERGAGALTIASVAKAAGITKGGVQSCFGTKEALIRALLERWAADEHRSFERELEGKDSVADRVAAHAKVTKSSNAANERAAGLMIALLQSPQYLDSVRSWYIARMAGLDGRDPDSRRGQLAFLAAEGAFFLRYFGLCEMSESRWNGIFKDIEDLTGDRPG